MEKEQKDFRDRDRDINNRYQRERDRETDRYQGDGNQRSFAARGEERQQ